MLTLRCAITQVVCLFALLSQKAWIRCRKCEKGAKEAEEEQLHCLKCSHTECGMLCPGLNLEARRGSEDYCLNRSQSFDVLVMLISWACRLCTGMFWPHSQDCPLAAGGPMLVLNAPQVGALHIIAVAQAIGIVNHLCLHATNFRQLRDHRLYKEHFTFADYPITAAGSQIRALLYHSFQDANSQLFVSKMQCRLAHAGVS